MTDLHAAVREFAARLRRGFAPEIKRDPRGFKCRVVRLLKAALPPGSVNLNPQDQPGDAQEPQ